MSERRAALAYREAPQLRQITALIDNGALRPVVGKVTPFSQTVQALQGLDKGGIRGKVVISSS